ncbi:MAG: T9SS type A sorting domain-containing protein [Ignavibacteria bacterium]|nr:T9SS type A sorting domain-containing protein [Ignavibacteria bacterium]
MTGKVSGGSTGYDIGTSRITSTGNLTWTNLYNGSGNGNDFGSSIAFDNSGALYVAGTSNEGSNGTDYIVIKYSTLFANQHWAAKYSLSTTDTLTSMMLDNSFNVYVCGHHKRFLNSDTDMGLYKLGSTIGIQPLGSEIPEKFELSQNYPNPFNPTTNIKLQIPESGLVKLVVFDVTGRVVAELVNETLNAGEYKVDFNASALTSGVYFYKLTAAGFTDTKRMVLVK